MKVNIRQKTGMNYLYADINVSGIRVKCTLGISVKDGEFNPKTQRVRGNAENETNILIHQFLRDIMELIRELQKTGRLSMSNIKQGVLSMRNKTTQVQPEKTIQMTFSQYIESHILRSVSTRRIGSVKQCKVTYGKIKLYETSHSIKLKFSDIDMVFYNSFIEFCTKRLALSLNTVGTHIKNIKMWMNSALLDGLHTSIIHQNRSFKKVTEDAESIYLTEEEILNIRMTVLPSTILETVRDVFVLACYTGVRSQDYGKLNFDHLINGNLLKVRTEKTDEEVIIPMHPVAKAILEKYQGTPRIISNQKFNHYIKEVCRFVGLMDDVFIARTYGGKRTTFKKAKWECVSSHTARRSFATNAYKSGVPTLAIMAITGHRTEKVFLKYIKVTKVEHAMLSSNHAFFLG